MSNPSNSDVQNLLPVQAYFNLDGSFNTFIGQGVPFYATANPSQSGLNITNSTINSTTIGATTPSTGVFTNIATTTGTITTAASGPTDIVNKQYVDYFAAGLSWKAPAITATGANITLSGLQTINGVTVVAGDTVLVKDQTNPAQNGIYIASATAWTYSVGGDTWNEYIGAIIFITSGSLSGTAWYCTAQPGGTLGVTAMNWSNFSVASSYTAGTGLQLIGTQFSIANTGVSAATYGSATASAVIAVNAQGQITSASNSTITPAVGSITGLGTGVATALAAGVTGSGNIVLATSPSLVTPLLGTPTSGDFSTGTFTWPTFNQNTTGTASNVTGVVAIANGGTGQTTASAAFNALSPMTTTGDIIYEASPTTAARLGIGSTGQVLTVVAGLPAWSTVAASVTSFSAGTTGLTPSTATTGAITLAGTLNVANGGTGTTTSTGTAGSVVLSNNPTLAGLTDSGNLTFTGTGNRITGDFSNGTLSNRVLFQDSTVNGQTSLGVIPNGSGTGSSVIIYNSSALDNASIGFLQITNSAVNFVSSRTGTGTNLPLTMSTGGSERLRITTAGGVAFGGASNFGTSGQLLQSAGDSSPTWVAQSTITAGSATNATNATNVGIVDDTTTATTVYPVWANNTSGNQALEVSSTKLSFVPSTGVLTTNSLRLNGSTSGTTTVNASAVAGTTTMTLPSQSGTLGYLNIPTAGTKSSSYTLALSDIGEFVRVDSGGSITIPNAVFAEGDVVSIFNNTTGGITITCTISTAYIAGVDSDRATVTLATRGVATILFLSSTVCVVTGNVS